ncbi:MAG TPA: heterodisulfide reductase-related iron-sulfur binding cluster [Thermoanaerobaculia bacterium]|nr:heterodisulfide reductase-related iron-sulfur binding cluster [Thermoanaerobaculia bacterium]
MPAGAPAPHAGRKSLYDDCVHCGFCLPACPTWHSWSEEMDSPRGRIDLMRGLAEGKLEWSPQVARHFDRCLGCLGCVPACPSGVRYDVLIEQTRARREDAVPRSGFDRLFREALFQLLPYPDRLEGLARLGAVYAKTGLRRAVRASGLLKLAPRRFAALEALMPETAGTNGEALPPVIPAVGPRRARVALLLGCVQRAFFPAINAATARVLAAEGCEVVVPPEQGCCGALSIHAGREEESLDLCRGMIAAFEPLDVEAVIVNAAGCGSHLKDYDRLLAGDPSWAPRAAALRARVKDVTEFLAALGPAAPRHPLRGRVAYHDACHLAHGQGIRQPPRDLLSAIPGLALVEIVDGDQCCGSAGIYNLVEPASADEIGERKVESVLAANADALASANPGCLLQIRKHLLRRGADLPSYHPVEILDASIGGRPLAGLSG